MLFDDKREAVSRALFGGVLGAVLYLVLALFSGAEWLIGVSPEDASGMPEALGAALRTALWFAFGAEIAVATLPFAGEGRALVLRTLVHFLAMAATLSAWVLLNFRARELPGFLLLLAGIYLLIWLGRWIGWYLEVAAIREKLGLAPGPSPLNWRETLPYLAFALLLCVGLPALLSLFDAADVPVLRALYFPYLFLPVGCFCSALSLWKRQGVCPLYPAGCALFTLAAVFLMYNSSALFFCAVAFVTALGGGLMGLLLKHRAFWTLTALALLAVNTLAAVLYAGAPALDRGGGFISFSPFIDMVWWGGVILLSGVPALVLGLRSRPALPRVPRRLAPAAAFLALQGALSVVILVLGPLFLDPFPWIAQIPFWGYVTGLSVLYLAAGAVWTGKGGGALGWTLLWCAAFTALFLALGWSELESIVQREAEYLRLEPEANLIPAGAHMVMNSARGAVLGRLDLPACVLIECYYEEGEALGRWTITALACLLPGVCLGAGSVCGHFIRKGRERP